jgi:hypothetical protein
MKHKLEVFDLEDLVLIPEMEDVLFVNENE